MPDDRFTPRRPEEPEDVLPAKERFSSNRSSPSRDEDDSDWDEDHPEEEGPRSDERTMAVLCHVGGFFTWIVLPLILWLSNQSNSRFVAKHGKEALNFQIFLGIVSLLMMIGAVVLVIVGLTVGMSRASAVGWAIAGGWIVFVMLIYETVFVGLASLAGWRGRAFRYPAILRVIR